jgi:hypothetical protein
MSMGTFQIGDQVRYRGEDYVIARFREAGPDLDGETMRPAYAWIHSPTTERRVLFTDLVRA